MPHECPTHSFCFTVIPRLMQQLNLMGKKRLKMGYSFCLDVPTSELPFAILSKSKETASSSLSSSSSFPWLGCLPFPYFGTMISLSQSKVCQIWRKTTQLPGSAVDHCWLNWVRELLGQCREWIDCRRAVSIQIYISFCFTSEVESEFKFNSINIS